MATTPQPSQFTGDSSLQKRPMGRVLDPLGSQSVPSAILM